jgi:two-component system LytT family response regulator
MQSGQAIKTVIIDDEQSAILLLDTMLKEIEGVSVAGHAQNVNEGLNLILQCRPDIVFLDIRIGEENGFNLARQLKEYDVEPFIVMVTGYDQYGLEAIKAGAFDYLVKPVDPVELLKTISRYRQKQSKMHSSDPVQKIRFNTLGGFILINPADILYCKAEANYTDIFLTSQHKHTISLNIGSIEKILTQPMFYRISRYAIINIKYLTEINRGKRFVTLSYLEHTHSLTISHDRIRELEGALVQ